MSYRPDRLRLNDGWRFRFQTEDTWQSVTLPHSWNALDTMSTDPDWHYRRGVGEYELDFVPPGTNDGQRIWLEFEAVAQKARVYFDDTLLTTHHGGYTSFTVSVPNRAGVLRVEADNTPDPDLIPSDRSDFFLYGGITRNVWLYRTYPCWIDSLFIHPAVSEDQGHLSVTLKLAGDLSLAQNVTLRLTDPEKCVVSKVEVAIESDELNLTMPVVETVECWSPDSPALYMLDCKLAGVRDETHGWFDEVIETVGFRTFEFPEYGTFHLNGEHLLLRGTHRHEDWAGYGGAVPDEITRHEFQMIKDAGFNFVRLGHYPQSRAALDACDELGLLVWEELPWCRGGVGGETFKQRTRVMLQEMIEQHHNHPSIIFWGLGNELDWESDHPDTTEADVIEFLRELQSMTRRLDPRRLTAVRRFEPAKDIVDVVSPSIWSGWYRGRYEDYETALTAEMRHYPRLLHIEWGGDSHAGRHNDGPHISTEVDSGIDHGEVPGTATSQKGFARYSRDGDWSESYIIDLMAHHLRVQSKMPTLAGTAQWVFKDFGTPLRPENPIPCVNQKGLLTRDGTPKDAYFVFQAFQSKKPIVRIESSAWDMRVGHENEVQRIRVITNCKRVKLLVDNKSQGVKLLDEPDVPGWYVPLSAGEHKIKALGYDGKKVVARHEIVQQFAAGNYESVVTCNVYTRYDENGMSVICQLVDSAARPVTNDERRIRFSGEGILRYHGVMGGSDLIETTNGLARICILPDTALPLTLHIEAAGLPAVETTLEAEDTGDKRS